MFSCQRNHAAIFKAQIAQKKNGNNKQFVNSQSPQLEEEDLQK